MYINSLVSAYSLFYVNYEARIRGVRWVLYLVHTDKYYSMNFSFFYLLFCDSDGSNHGKPDNYTSSLIKDSSYAFRANVSR